MNATITPNLRFNAADAQRANEEWGCNCGPAALAFAAGKTLDEIRPCVAPLFEQRGYMNLTMMREAIPLAGLKIVGDYGRLWPHTEGVGLVRIQWGGPWIINGKAARWAACHTHWVAAKRVGCQMLLYVFDINGGYLRWQHWEREVVPKIVASIGRADGTWTVTHSWKVEAA